ncbi:MAG: TetR/AcrR family transcriptional regulator [Atopobiaceae bacterium]|nr:TetR/AcrR family transcriptional regulator [Atopobiaceae bacterium]
MANTHDLRYVRTEEAIRSAFMALVVDGPASSVTASALCRRADISRNAFYLHYASVGDLYVTLVNELVADVSAEAKASALRVMTTGGVDRQLPSALVNALAKHEGFLRSLLPSDDGSLAKCLAEGLEGAYVDAALVINESGGGFEHRMSCAFAAWALVGLVVRWINTTDLPLEGALPLFEQFQTGLSESATHFLTQG